MTITKSLASLSAPELNVILNIFHLDVPGRLSTQEKLTILKYHSGYTTPFGKFSFDQVLATFANDNKAHLKFVSLKTIDGKVCVKALECDSPCTVCKKDVLNGTGPLGDGIVCSHCSNYFHNACTSSPLDRKSLTILNRSPNYVQLICPLCMPIVSSKSDSARESNTSKLVSDMKILKECVTDIYALLEKHCYFVTTDKGGISSNLLALSSEMEKTKTKIDLLDIAGTCEAVPDLCNELSGKLDEVSRSVTTTMTSMEQSVDHAVTKVSQLERFSFDELASKVDEAIHNIRVPESSPDTHVDVVKEIKLVHKKLEMQCEDIKEDTATIKESCATLTDVKSTLSGNGTGDRNASLCDKADLEAIKEKSDKILHEVSLIPSGIKANKKWDDLEQLRSSATLANVASTSNSTGKTQRPALAHQSAQEANRLCDEKRTIAIDNIISFEKFVKKSYDTKKEFNKHFPRTKIVQCKRTRHGSLLIEVEDIKTATEIVQKWNPSFFSIDAGMSNKTTASLLQNRNIRGIVTDVDISVSDSTMLEEFKEQFGWTDIKIRRFIDKQGVVRPTVLVNFTSSEQLEQATRKGIFFGNVFCEIRVLSQRLQ